MDIPALAALVSTRKQYDYRATTLSEIDAIAGTLIDPHFRRAFTYGFDVFRMPCSKALYSCENTSTSAYVAQAVNPLGESGCLSNLNHAGRV